jgi:hypothetical protein
MNRMLPLAIVAALVLAVGAYLFYDRAQPACEGIYQQTALRIGGQVETIAAKGGLVMGREQIQALTEGAQKVGQHLRTCCAVLDAGRISGEQFQTCVAGAGQYEARLAQVASAVEQVSDARSAGQEAVAAQKTDQLEGLVDLATRGATDYTRQVAALTAESTSAAPTSATTPAEPNDTPAQASPIEPATAVTGAITEGDRDYYRFRQTGPVRDAVEIRIENRGAGFAPQLTLYDAAKSQLMGAYDTTAGADLARRWVMESGAEYYVQVQSVGGTGEYALSVRPLRAADANEPNDDAFHATPVAAGGEAQGSILDHKDADWFRLSGVTPGAHRLRLENGSTTLMPQLTVFNADKQQVGHNYQTTPGANLTLEFEADAAAGPEWLVRVMPFSDGTGEYRLALQ